MCFYKTEPYDEPLIAMEDIKVFKHLEKRLFTLNAPYRGTIYFFNFLSFNKRIIRAKFKESEINSKYIVDNGIHAYISDKSYSLSKTLYNAIIPKGTRYFINYGDNEIVAEKLIVYRQKQN